MRLRLRTWRWACILDYPHRDNLNVEEEGRRMGLEGFDDEKKRPE